MDWVSSGLREFRRSSLYCANAWPRRKSLPGLVKISMRAKPGRSYSGENGLAVDADFADRGLRRQTAAGEAVDEELAAAGTGSRTGQRLQLQRELVRVVREGRELPLAQHHAAAIGFGRRADAAKVVLHGDDLRFAVDRQLDVENLRRADGEVLLLCRRESLGGDADLILAGVSEGNEY